VSDHHTCISAVHSAETGGRGRRAETVHSLSNCTGARKYSRAKVATRKFPSRVRTCGKGCGLIGQELVLLMNGGFDTSTVRRQNYRSANTEKLKLRIKHSIKCEAGYGSGQTGGQIME